MSEKGEDAGKSARWQRRDARRRKERERLKQHGASLRRVYADAIRKRAQAARTKSG